MTPYPLRLLCVGTGRDGTVSLASMIQSLYDHEGNGRDAMHEYAARPFYNAYAEYRETGGHRHLLEIRRLIAECPHNAIIGNGYAAVLPLFAERYPDLTLIHVRRRDRAACISSLRRDCELFPAAYRYYSEDPQANMKRLAAFHVGALPRESWDALTLDEKFGWYYDKTHELITESTPLFKRHFEVNTEALEHEQTRRTIAEAVLGNSSWFPRPAHMNAHRIDIGSVPKNRQVKMQWLVRKLNLHWLADDDVYAIDYFLEKFVAWTGYQITNTPNIDASDRRTNAQLNANLERAEGILRGRLREIEGLKRMVAEREET
jgi:hypothetical protein